MQQLNIFDLNKKEIKIDKPIRLIELFGGYGSQSMALERIGAEFERYKLVEFDRYAIESYNTIHNTDFEPLDITKVHRNDLDIVDTNKYCYIMTYSFPCQDLSVAGNQNGMSKGSGTKSGLLWEVERLLKEIIDNNGELPQILFMENVKQVISKKNMPDFEKWCKFLENIGYTNTYKVLNAKDYGIPQNRERCFMFSFLGDYKYNFPESIPLKYTVKDLLEPMVDEKYYIKTDNAKRMIEKLIEDGKLPIDEEISVWDKCTNNPQIKNIANCIMSKDYGIVSRKQSENAVIEIKQLGNMVSTGNFENPQVGRIYDTNGFAPTLNTCGGGGHEPKILEQIPCKLSKRNEDIFKSIGEATIKSLNTKTISTILSRYYKGASGDNDNMVIVAMRGRNPDNPSDKTIGSPTEQRLEPNTQGISNCITSVQKDNLVLEERSDEIVRTFKDECIGSLRSNVSECGKKRVCEQYVSEFENIKGAVYHDGYWYRIRKLTPKECGKLMGVTDSDIDKMAAVNSNTQLYKQFGNSIVVNCMVAMFSNLNIQGLPKWEEIKEDY